MSPAATPQDRGGDPQPPGQVGALESAWKWVGPTRPIGIGLLLGLTTVAGLLARQDGVFGALAFWRWRRGLDLHPPTIWLLAVLALQGLMLGVDASFRKKKEAKAETDQARLNDQITQIERNQQTLPPLDVVDGIVEAIEAVHRAELLLLREPTSDVAAADNIDETVRFALSAVTSLVQRHDRAGRRGRAVEYSGNIMVFVEASKLEAPMIAHLESNNLFKSDGLSLDRIPGVLHLKTEWAVSTAGPEGRDVKVNELVLQLPEEYAAERELLALPGAPSAWCACSIDICSNVTEIPKRLQAEGTGTRRQADAIRKYFESPVAKHIRSFISLHLPAPPGSTDPRPIGVVNINCSEPGLFGDAARRELVLPFLHAMMGPLAVIVDTARRRVEGPFTGAAAAKAGGNGNGGPGGRRSRRAGGSSGHSP